MITQAWRTSRGRAVTNGTPACWWAAGCWAGGQPPGAGGYVGPPGWSCPCGWFGGACWVPLGVAALAAEALVGAGRGGRGRPVRGRPLGVLPVGVLPVLAGDRPAPGTAPGRRTSRGPAGSRASPRPRRPSTTGSRRSPGLRGTAARPAPRATAAPACCGAARASPRIAAAVAQPAATIATTCMTDSTCCVSMPIPSRGGSEIAFCTRSRVSRERRLAIRSKTVSTTAAEPRIVTQPAMVTWGGRAGAGSVMASLFQPCPNPVPGRVRNPASASARPRRRPP